MKKVKRNLLKENKFIIDSCDLKCNSMYCSTIIIEKKQNTIIRGKILDSNEIPLDNVVIEVIEINLCLNKRKTIGYTCTNSEGKYALCIPIHPEMSYKFVAYSPLE